MGGGNQATPPTNSPHNPTNTDAKGKGQFAPTLNSREVNNALAADPALWASLAGVEIFKQGGKEYGVKGDSSVSISFEKGVGHDHSQKHTSGTLVTLGASLCGESSEDFANRAREALGYPQWGERLNPSQQAHRPQRRPSKTVPFPYRAEIEAREARERREEVKRIARVQRDVSAMPRVIDGPNQPSQRPQDELGCYPEMMHLCNRGATPEVFELMDREDWRYSLAFNFAYASKGEAPDYHRAVIAIVRDHHSGQAISYQAVAIDDQGGKAWPRNGKRKKTIGSYKGGGVYVTGWDRVGSELALCEGWETGLSLASLGIPHVCACLGADNMGNFPLVEGIQRIRLYPVGDLAGMRAAEKVKQRYDSAGSEASIISAPRGQDWGDLAA